MSLSSETTTGSQALHFDGSSFGSQLLRAETGTLLNTVIGNIAAGSNPFLHLQGNLIDGATSFAGSYLAHLIATPNSTIGHIGSSVGGWLGSAIGAVLDHSHAVSLDQLAGELKVAESYSRYRANKHLIDDLVALNSNAALAAGWGRHAQQRSRNAAFGNRWMASV